MSSIRSIKFNINAHSSNLAFLVQEVKRMVTFHAVCSARILTLAMLVSLWPSFAHAADMGVSQTDRLQYFIDSGKLHHSIKKQMEQKGEAEALVILDGTEAKAMAEDTKKLLGIKQDNDDIVNEKARLHKKKASSAESVVRG